MDSHTTPQRVRTLTPYTLTLYGTVINDSSKKVELPMRATPLPAAIDEEGYLIEPNEWTEEIALELARYEQIELTDMHWSAIRFMRDYYAEHQIAPDARFVIRYLAAKHGAERNALFQLFPYGYVKQACKIAGMKRPRAWSTG